MENEKEQNPSWSWKTEMGYFDKRVLVYSCASVVAGFCVFLYLLFTHNWWELTDEFIDSGSRLAILRTINQYWLGLFKVLLLSFLTILFHVAVFDRPVRERGSWRYLLTPITYPLSVMVAFVLLQTIFSYNQDFRTPPGNTGVLDPVKVYFVASLAAYFLTLLVDLFVRLLLAILDLLGIIDG